MSDPTDERSRSVQGKLINLKGQVFGTLTVMRRCYPWEVPGYRADEARCKTRQARWVCRCACGNVKILISQNIRRGERVCRCVPVREPVVARPSRATPLFGAPQAAHVAFQ
jgi:hypothetical protein